MVAALEEQRANLGPRVGTARVDEHVPVGIRGLPQAGGELAAKVGKLLETVAAGVLQAALEAVTRVGGRFAADDNLERLGGGHAALGVEDRRGRVDGRRDGMEGEIVGRGEAAGE